MEDTCYCCGEPSVGRGDHVPPLAMFPKGAFSTRSPIIVPSCEVHNPALSNADEYLRLIMASSAAAVDSDVRRRAVDSVMRHAKKPGSNLERFGMERTREGLKVGATAPVNHDLLEQALGKVARGIYHHHHGRKRKLIGMLDVYPIFLGLEDETPEDVRQDFARLSTLVAKDLAELPVHGDIPDVFRYQVLDGEDYVMVNLVFYRAKIASVIRRVD